ncbi:DUF2304 domain-containing protein [Actinomyces sp. B33]|uniref:DUF2304 domain-containing protein n=1 Tax=Actinomyces sp. B33 TaxID=2942131 RepID=UPI0023418235|nr:DUF2304 domain-containing protein [Actinomyces sp. B33]MDC4232629.1 DUF2304 domain-containing protein [Actinomyces sp. B33]
MTHYLLIRVLLLGGLVVIAWWLVRPVRSQSHLAVRRLSMMALVVFAMVAVALPGALNRAASALGVERGVNLLVYALVLALLAQAATAYRREAAAERRITDLARAVALSHVSHPEGSIPADPAGRGDPAGSDR